MKKIISLFLCLLLFILCVPCDDIHAEGSIASFSLNYCDKDGNNNEHIIFENGVQVPYEWTNSKNGSVDDLEELGLEIVSEYDVERNVYTYIVKISDDVDLYFNTFNATNDDTYSQENKLVINRIFPNCINALNAILKIESVDGDHTLNIHFLNNSIEQRDIEIADGLNCIYNNAPRYTELLSGFETGACFGSEDNDLELNFYCGKYDDDEDAVNPIVSAFYFGSNNDNDTYLYNIYFNNLKSNAVLTGGYYYSYASGATSTMYFSNNCDIDFTNVDPFSEYSSNRGNFERTFIRTNSRVCFDDCIINAHLNQTNLEFDDKGNIDSQRGNSGIASMRNIEFKDSIVHMEGIAALATAASVIIDNTKAEFIGRLAGIISISGASGCIQYINPGSDSYLVIETLKQEAVVYDVERIGETNVAVALVPSQILPQLISSGSVIAECSKTVDGDDYKLLSVFNPSEYSSIKRIKIGNPYDFELRYYDDGTHKSCKYYKGTHLKDTNYLPEGLTLEKYDKNAEYPYILTVDGERTIYCDVNNLVQINDINKFFPVAYGLYFTQNLLIQGKDENSKLKFEDFGDANENMFSYDIVSGDVNPDVKLKITIPYLHFNNGVSNFETAEFGTGSRLEYDYPNLFNISSYNIEINGVNDGLFTTSNVGIEYLSNLTITDSKLRFFPMNYICASDDSFINFIVSNSEAEDEYTKLSKCSFNQSEITFDGSTLLGTNLGVHAAVAANFIDISLGKFEVNDSEIIATNANFMVGPAEFIDCPKIILNNANSASSVPNFISCGGTLSFSNSNYEIISMNNNIEFRDYFDGPDFKLYFEQDEEHSGSFTANGGCCISAEDVEVTKSDTTEILANTLMDGSVNVPYNNDDRDTYKYLLINYLPPLPNIVEVPILYPTTTGDGHIHYYYDEVNDLYYEDPFGNIPILDIDKWLSTRGRIPSLKEENKKCDLTVYTISTREIIPSLTIKLPVKENDYLFESDYIGRFIGVVINNKPLTMKVDYSLVEGDTPIIKLSDAVLNSLPNGTNKIYIVFIDGFGYKEFTIKKESKPNNPSKPSYNPPKTGIK